MDIKIGIIGGSGLDNLNIFTNARDTFTGTVWGEPSSPLREGEIAGVPVIVLARHGRSHTIAPSSVNYRANIQALKDAGCTHILATTATGSSGRKSGAAISSFLINSSTSPNNGK